MARRAIGVVDKHIGNRIRTVRMARGVSQEKLGDALGLTFQQVQKYEKGKNHIAIPTLLDIAKVLKVTIAYFFEGIADTSASAPEADPLAEFAADRRGFSLAQFFMAIDSVAGRDAVLTVAEAFATAAKPDVRKAA